MLFLPSRINKSIKLNIKNIALSLFSVLSFFLSHLRITVIYKSTNNFTLKIDQCITSAFDAKNKKPHECGAINKKSNLIK